MIKICDTHNDFLTELSNDEAKKYLNGCKINGVKKLCSSFWTSKKQKNQIFDELIVKSKILTTDKKTFLLHIEDLWWVEDRDNLDFLLKVKPFSCSLTWNNANCLAGGANSSQNLTKWGKFCIKKLMSAGVLIDLSHLNKKSFYAVADIVKNNLFCSHTGFYGVKKHRRNLTDKQIDIIVKSGGFIGLFFFDKCIKNSKKQHDFCVKDIVQNIKYFSSRFGCDNIGIGSDFYGIDIYPKDLKNYKEFRNLENELKNAGYSKIQIEKILYKNFMSFLLKISQ